MIRLQAVGEAQRELLWNINQKYLYEMTLYYQDDMDEKGNYDYGYFDAYFTEPQRAAYLIYEDQALAGFAMINPYSYLDRKPDHVMAEFTVFPAFRRRGLARTAAEMLLARFPGSWEIKYNEKNAAAKALWNAVAAPYAPERHGYSDTETVLCFTVPKESD